MTILIIFYLMFSVECLVFTEGCYLPLALKSSSLNDIAKIRNRRRGIWHFCALSCTFVLLNILLCTFLSGFSEIIKDGADLASGEILAVGVVACALQLLAELGNAVDPTHQVAGGGAWVAGGEVEHCKLLFAITADFHFYQKLKLKSLFPFAIIILSKITPSLFTIKESFSNHPVPLSKEGSTFSPSPSSSGSGDVAGDAIALPEFWYRQRSLYPQGVADDFLRNRIAIVCAVLHRLAESLLARCLGAALGFALAVGDFSWLSMGDRGGNAER